MRRTLAAALVTALTALVWSASAGARGGHYVFDGGTASQQQQVTFALDVSRFNWNLVPETITIHLQRGSGTFARPGGIWIDTELLDAGVFAWGPIQHEYAHQVDFFLLDTQKRVLLNRLLGGKVWSYDASSADLSFGHSSLGAERFASTLAWSYWQSPANSLKPSSPNDESAAMEPARFRSLLGRLLAPPHPAPQVLTVG